MVAADLVHLRHEVAGGSLSPRAGSGHSSPRGPRRYVVVTCAPDSQPNCRWRFGRGGRCVGSEPGRERHALGGAFT